MRKKLLSLVLALVMCIGLTVPAMAVYEVKNSKCTYELSNNPIGTIEYKFCEIDWENATSVNVTRKVYIVPDNTTVISKTVPNGSLPYVICAYGDDSCVDPMSETNAGEPFTVYPHGTHTFGLKGPLIWRVFSKDLNTGYLDYDEGGINLMAQSSAVEAGLTIQGSTAPGNPSPTPANNAGDTYNDEHITVTNVTSTGKGQYTVDVEEHPEENWPEITCNAPAEITLDMSKGNLAQYAPLATYWDSGRTDITNGKITLTQPGTYVIDYFYGEGYYQCYYIVVKNGSTSPSGNTTGFTDIAATDYFATPVAWAVDKGITNGTGNNQFSPGQNCTNAQILTFLWRAYGEPEPIIGNPFTNSIPDAYTKAAIWAYEKGMVSGTAFDVDTPCTRAMAVTYMWQAAGSPMPFASVDSFSDVSADASYALAVAWALEKGITTGTSATTFSPADICNRGQIVTFLHRNLA